ARLLLSGADGRSDRRRRGARRGAADASRPLRGLGAAALGDAARRLLDAPPRAGPRLRRRAALAPESRRDPAPPARGDRPRARPLRAAAPRLSLPAGSVTRSPNPSRRSFRSSPETRRGWPM